MAELTVTIGDNEYPFKRVNLTTFKKHLEFMKASARMARDVADGKPTDPGAALAYTIEMAEIIHECIVRARSEVTLQEVMDGLDQGNINEAYGKVMSGSGYVPAGEPKAAAV